MGIIKEHIVEHLKLGTRGSKLALWQAHFIKAQLEAVGTTCEIVIIKTRGDQIQDIGFSKMEGKGFFTKEIEDALLEGKIDFAVHSMKDMPTTNPPGLVLTALSYREDPRDCLVIKKSSATDGLLKLPESAIVGTSSARRKAQLLHYRSDLNIQDIRGNVPTRLKKLQEESFDAIVLAKAGLERLKIDLSDFEYIDLNPREFVPAPAQGVIALQVREDDTATRRLLQQIHHADVARCTNIERKVLQLMDGGCQMPLGVHCEMDQENNFHVHAAFAKSWDAPVKFVHCSQSTSINLAEKIHQALLED